LTSFLALELEKILQELALKQRIWIAYSGGLDSHVLLHALVHLRDRFADKNAQLSESLCAVHIHHGLQQQADDWAQHCQHICQQLAIPCHLIKVKVKVSARESLEACAREARYAALSQLLTPDDCVLTAQHADDQAETVLLQLFRGAGVDGLAAMPQKMRLGQGWLLRPLLTYRRAQLQHYAHQHQLQWIEDSSNQDQRFDRNFLRHQIMPRLQQRWPSLTRTLSRAAYHQSQAQYLIEELAAADWHHCSGARRQQLYLPTFTTLSAERQRNLLRFWLKKLQLPQPPTTHIQRILTEVIPAGADRQPLVQWRGGEVRRYRQYLWALPPLPPSPAQQVFTWSPPQTLTLPLGQLIAQQVYGQGLVLNQPLQVRFRQGGEQFYWRGHQRTVKKILQQLELPPWLRPFLPLIYFADTLVAIPKVGICDNFSAGTEQWGWVIQWQRR